MLGNGNDDVERWEQFMTTAPGWYLEPNGSGGSRWWDGSAWTEHVHVGTEASGVPAAKPTLVYTPWIWIMVVLPSIASLPQYFIDFSRDMPTYSQLRQGSNQSAMLALYSDPAYLASAAAGWVVYGLLVLFAFFDRRALIAGGHQRTFHWAWTFLLSLVYVIGRSVVVRRQTGRGFAPMWVAIALVVVGIIGSVFRVVSITSAILSNMPG